MSGTVTQTANLGLPEIPGAGGSRSSEFNSLISGTHTLRVWYAAPDKSRIALLGTLGRVRPDRQRDRRVDLVQRGQRGHPPDDRPGGTGRGEGARRQSNAPADMPKTPQEAADRFLAAVGPTTEVATDSDVDGGRPGRVRAGAPARATTRSLITEVRIAVDGEKFVPLRVRVFATGHRAGGRGRLHPVDFTVPDDGQFAFNPPPGAKVTEVKPEADAARKSAAEKKAEQQRRSSGEAATTRRSSAGAGRPWW